MEIHEQLRQARERRGITIESLQDRTGIRVQVLTTLERGDYASLPTGLYGRHAVRAYARTVGLDADAVLTSIARLLPEPEDPLDGLARVRGFDRKARAVEPQAESMHWWMDGLADDYFSIDWRRILAAAIDGGVLLGFAVGLIAITKVAAGASLATLAPIAAPAWTLLIGLVSVMYFALLGGIGHETAGARLRQRLGRGRPAYADGSGAAGCRASLAGNTGH
jgi:transcriptional regulator with XRE-family HTH domain